MLGKRWVVFFPAAILAFATMEPGVLKPFRQVSKSDPSVVAKIDVNVPCSCLVTQLGTRVGET